MNGIFLARPAEPREGIPLAVKDLFDTAGLTTTYGSAIFRDHVPDDRDGRGALLEAAGYANVGKTNLHEFAYGITSVNPHYGTVPNPRWPGRMAGGSSGGSAAAVAAGLAEVGLGTDSGGSIRIPAACCGARRLQADVRARPDGRLLPARAVLRPRRADRAPSVEDCAAAMAALAPGSRRRRRSRSPTCASASPGSSTPTRSCARASRRPPRGFPHAAPARAPARRGIGAAFMREVADVHRELFAEHAAEYGDNVRTKIERCLRTDRRAERGRAERAREYRERANGGPTRRTASTW